MGMGRGFFRKLSERENQDRGQKDPTAEVGFLVRGSQRPLHQQVWRAL